MKKIILTISAIFICAGVGSLCAKNIGVPAESEDVMLQAFYWDSYKTQSATDSRFGRTKWVDLLQDTAAINRDFDLVWFPPSAWAGNDGGVGYYHRQASNQDGTSWGSKTKLEELIAALHKGGTKCLADIVINHRNNKSSWTDFYPDNFGSYGSFQLTQSHICSGDEAFTSSSSPAKGSTTHGAADTGNNDGGCRDLDHTSVYVQNWAKAYVQWMLNVMKYDGFRYDMTLGYHGQYLKMYNEASRPYISVSELWDGIARQKRHLQECDSNTMIFDFQQKYQLREAIVGGSYGKLKKNTNSFRGQGLERYAVTFVDNHDTFDRGSTYGNNQFTPSTDLSLEVSKRYVMQAYAYLMAMPGIPCVFYPHWASYKEEISELIAIRKRVGIHSESVVLEETSGQYQYSATVQGHRGRVIVRVGKNRSQDVPEGYELAAEGGEKGAYSVYVCMGALGVENPALKVKGTKFVRNGKLYIRVGERVYDITGNKIQ